MKKSTYSVRKETLLVVQQDTLDAQTGELSSMPVPLREKTPAFAYVFVKWHERIGDDSRMTGEPWRVLSKMIGHTEFTTNRVKLRLPDLVRETGLPQRSVLRAITTLRAVGALTPSQGHGEYHLSIQLLYKGNLGVRRRLLRQQEAKR